MAFPWYLVKSVEDGKINITNEGNIRPSSGPEKPEQIIEKNNKPKTIRRKPQMGRFSRN